MMRDASTPSLRSRRAALRACAAGLLWAAASSLGGCAGGNSVNDAYAMATPTNAAATVAFDQIDGPPPQVFDRMVNVLDSESKLRSLAIVSREGPAAYRVRSYISAQVVSGKTVISWVWDVYDRNQTRALRLSGEEPAGRQAGDPWSGADDLVLRKIAQAGFSGLTNMLNGTGPVESAPPSAPARSGPAIADAAPAAADNNVAALGFADR